MLQVSGVGWAWSCREGIGLCLPCAPRQRSAPAACEGNLSRASLLPSALLMDDSAGASDVSSDDSSDDENPLILATGNPTPTRSARPPIPSSSLSTWQRIAVVLLSLWTLVVALATFTSVLPPSTVDFSAVLPTVSQTPSVLAAPFSDSCPLPISCTAPIACPTPISPSCPTSVPAPSVSSFDSPPFCLASLCVPSPQGDYPSCCFTHRLLDPSILSSPTYDALTSYNFCPLPHQTFPFELNPTFPNNGDQFQHHYPTLLDGQTSTRLFLMESRYEWMSGMMQLLVMMLHLHPEGRSYGRFYELKEWKDQIDELRPHLSCRYTLNDGRSISSPFHQHTTHEGHTSVLRCPWPLHPLLPPHEAINFTLWVDYDSTRPFHVWTQGEEAIAQPTEGKPASVPLPICPEKRPLIEFAWCGKGMKGEQVGAQVVEAILRYRSLGVKRFMVFDSDGTHHDLLLPFVTAGLLDYVHSPSFIPEQDYDFWQNLQYDVCRSRYWQSTQWTIYTDPDEFIAFNQHNLSDWQHSRMSSQPGVAGGIEGMQDFVVQLQNMAEHRQAWVIGVELQHCAAIQVDPLHANSTLQTLRFPWCNRYFFLPKHFERNHLSCMTGQHNLHCSEPHLYVKFQRMDQAMIVHYRSAIVARDAEYEEGKDGDVSVWIEGLREAVYNDSSYLTHLLKPYE